MKRIILVLILLLGSVAYAEDDVLITTIYPYSFKINDVEVRNEESLNPVLYYNNVAYVPLVSNYNKALGIEVISNDEGLYINKITYVDTFRPVMGSKNILSEKVEFQIITKPVYTNGTLANVSDEHPVISYNDIMYIPVLWPFLGDLDWDIYDGLLSVKENNYGLGVMKPRDKVMTSTEIGNLVKASVKVIVQKNDGSYETGSGFYYGLGKLITTYDFMENSKRIYLEKYDDTETKNIYMDFDTIGNKVYKNLVLFNVDKGNNEFFNIGDSKNIKVGQKIYVISSPKGYRNVLTEGVISKVENELFQITAKVSQGSQGGVVLDEYGNAIGIISDQFISNEDIGFAIPFHVYDQIQRDYGTTRLESKYASKEEPVKPEGLILSLTDDGNMLINWDNMGADYYKLYYSKDGVNFEAYKAKYNVINRFDWNIEGNAIISTIEPNELYYFKVTSIKNGIESEASEINSSSLKPYTVSDFQNHLLDEYGDVLLDYYKISFYGFEIVVDEENDSVTAIAYVDFRNLIKGLAAITFDTDEFLRKLSSIASVVNVHFNNNANIVVMYVGEFEEYTKGFSTTKLIKEPIVFDNNTNTYKVVYPFILTNAHYNTNHQRYIISK